MHVLKQPAFFPLVREELPLGAAARVQAAYRALEELWDVLPPGDVATEVSRLQSRLLELQESLGGQADLDVYGMPRGAFAAYPDEDEQVDRLGALRRGRPRH